VWRPPTFATRPPRDIHGVAALVAAVVLSSLISSCSTSPTCDDAAKYNEEVYEAGAESMDEDSMHKYITAQENLAAAEADCDAQGEAPSY
jgi:hypothetical protein